MAANREEEITDEVLDQLLEGRAAVSVWLLELKWRTPWLSGHCTTVKGGVVRAQGTD